MNNKKFEFTYEGIIDYINRVKVFAVIRLIAVILIGVATLYTSIKVFYAPNQIGGIWIFDFETNESSFNPYIGLNTGYKMFITQKDADIFGSGEKYWENDIEIPANQHVQLSFKGKIEGKKILIHFEEYGKKRTTIGEISLNLKRDSLAEGSFTSTAANSKGIVFAKKVK